MDTDNELCVGKFDKRIRHLSGGKSVPTKKYVFVNK